MGHFIAVFAGLVGGLASAFAGVTTAELEGNPLWLPETTSIKGDLSFTSGEKVTAGRAYTIYAVKGDQLFLWFSHGRGTFKVECHPFVL